MKLAIQKRVKTTNKPDQMCNKNLNAVVKKIKWGKSSNPACGDWKRNQNILRSSILSRKDEKKNEGDFKGKGAKNEAPKWNVYKIFRTPEINYVTISIFRSNQSTAEFWMHYRILFDGKHISLHENIPLIERKTSTGYLCATETNNGLNERT